MARLRLLIEAEDTIGRGETGDPRRKLLQYWTPEGELIAELDPNGPVYDRCTGEWVLREGHHRWRVGKGETPNGTR